MIKLVFCHHENDAEIAEALKNELIKFRWHVILEKHPVQETLWEGGWSSLYPTADMVLVLITEQFAQYISEEQNGQTHNTVQNRISQHDSQVPVVPLVIEKVDFPDIFVGITALLLPSEKPELLAGKFRDYAVNLLSQNNRAFISRMRYISIVLLILSALSFSLLNLDILFDFMDIFGTLFMISLGALAACSHVLFNITGVLHDETFDIGKVEKSYLRIVLGATMGWVVYAMLINSTYIKDPNFLAICMGATYLAGFSSKLVVSVINLAISGVERAFQLEKDDRKQAGEYREK